MATWKKKGQTVTESNKITTTTKESEDYNMKTIKKGSKGNAVKVWQIIIGAAPDGNFWQRHGAHDQDLAGQARAGGGWNRRGKELEGGTGSTVRV